MAGLTHKHCRGCDRTLPVSAFAKSKAAKTGYQSRCKACMKAKYKNKSRQVIKIDGKADNFKKQKFSREQLLHQISLVKQGGEGSRIDYSFLDKVEKMNK